MKLTRYCRLAWHDHYHVTSIIFLFFSPLVLFVLTEWFDQPFGLLASGPSSSLVNITLIALLLVALWLLTGRLRVSLLALAAMCFLLTLTNHYLLRFRGTPLLPWDVYSWRTAANVAGGYDYRLDTAHCLMVVLFGLYALGAWRCTWCCTHWSWRRRLGCLAATLAVLAGFTSLLWQPRFLQQLYFVNNLFQLPETVAHDGLLASQLIHARQLFHSPPPHYSPEKAQTVLAHYAAPEATPTARPHLIAIMNETFADLSVYGDLQLTADPLPHLHALQAASHSAQTGWLHVSVKGGTTANSEWEFLTTGSTAFLPSGSVPYLQFSQARAPALPHYLRQLGYQTTSIHPYYPSGWKRNAVYPLLGFQTSLFADNFTTPHMVHGFISDEAAYDKIIEVFEAKNPNKPQFIWEVTMQNHSGYVDCAASMPQPIHAGVVTNSSLDCYLSLLAESDRQLDRLLDYFARVGEPVVIAFFGDHQPSDDITRPIRAALAQSSSFPLPDIDYVTPYLIWTNFPTPARSGDTSANYLSLHFLQAAGLPLSPHQRLAAAAEQAYPLLTSQLAVGADGVVSTPDQASDALADYRLVQYWWLAGDKGNEKI